MADQLAASVIRVFTASGAVAGAGFLASDRHVISCGHVVAQALGIPQDSPEKPTGEVQLDFPLLAPGQMLSARVVYWAPIRSSPSVSNNGGDDIAALELSAEPPPGSSFIPLVAVKDLWNHSFRAFGFPSGYDNGIWASGVMRSVEASGWLQIEDVKTTGYTVAPGFSGTPVWDEQVQGAVGMVVVAERRADVKAAFIIPASKLVEAWPPLQEQTVPPCPYRGLFAFREEDAAFFFGRESFTDHLGQKVAKEPLVAVIGPSGSGKSSIVFAGLIPRLRAEGTWLIASFRPADGLFSALSGALLTLLEPGMTETDRLVEAKKMADALRHGQLKLHDVVRRILKKEPSARRLLLVADQFEEVYTHFPDKAEQQLFVDCLLAAEPAGQTSPELVLVLTMRADFLGRALAYRPFADALQSADLKLGPMTRQELQDAIEKPALKLGTTIEDGLTERIIDAVSASPGDLPLLEFALTLLWAKQARRSLTHAAYDEIGGVEKALVNHADDVYSGLNEDEQQRVQRLLVRLVRPGEGTEDTRYVAGRSEIASEDWHLMTRLADRRLVVSGRDEISGEETVELVHEALIRTWGRLRQWMAVDRSFRTWQHRLSAAERQWEASGRDEGALLRGVGLTQAAKLLAERGADLSAEERQYIEFSVQLRERERAERERERTMHDRLQRRVTRTAIAAAVFCLSLAVLAAFQWRDAEAQRDSANEQTRLALSRQLAAQSLTHLDDQFDLAVLLGLEAYRVKETMESRGSLLYGLASNPGLITFLRGDTGGVSSLAFSPDGKTLLAGTGGGAIASWDVTRKSAGQPVAGHPLGVKSIAVSSDGGTLASAGCSNLDAGSCSRSEIRLWSTASGQPLGAPLVGHRSAVTSLAFSPENRSLASSSEDKSVILWDLTSRVPIRSFPHTARVQGVAFSPDGQTLGTGDVDGKVTLWDLATAQPRGEPGKHTDEVRTIAFSPDGATLASGSLDGSVLLWEVTSMRQRGEPLFSRSERIESLAFSPDGSMLATGTREHAVILWDVGAHQQIGQPLVGHSDRVESVTFSRDGSMLATGSLDGTIILWDIPTRLRRGRPVIGHTATVASVAFSPDGKVMASGGLDHKIVLWDVASGQPLGSPLAGHDDEVRSVAFSPDGRSLASGSRNGSVIVWNARTREPLHPPMRVHTGSIKGLVFSPDSTILASGSRDESIILWDVANGRTIAPPLKGDMSPVFGIAISPDGRTLAAGTRDKGVFLWDLATRQLRAQLTSADGNPVESVAFSAAQPILASSSGPRILLWDLATNGQMGQPLAGHRSDLQALAFSPDGRTLASGGAEGIILWDAATHQQVGLPLNAHTDWVQSLAFSPDGALVAAGTRDHSVVLWDVSFDAWQRGACGIIARNLTQEEWHQYVGSEPYRKTCPDLP